MHPDAGISLVYDAFGNRQMIIDHRLRLPVEEEILIFQDEPAAHAISVHGKIVFLVNTAAFELWQQVRYTVFRKMEFWSNAARHKAMVESFYCRNQVCAVGLDGSRHVDDYPWWFRFCS